MRWLGFARPARRSPALGHHLDWHAASGRRYYLPIARCWADYAFTAALTAHLRGDATGALSAGETLTKALPQIEAPATKLGLVMPTWGDKKVAHLPDYRFTQLLPEILADAARRVVEPPAPTLAAVKENQSPNERIAALVDLLDEFNEEQSDYPGAVSLRGSPIVQALIAEGEAAVEPLLDCLESDNRMTRSADFRLSTVSRIVPVYHTAYVALEEIFATRHFGPNTARGARNSKREEVAKEVRAFWLRAKGRTTAERWYDTLALDEAHWSQWVEAAFRIVEPDDGKPDHFLLFHFRHQLKFDQPMRGESLRALKDPTLAELLAKRVPQIAAWERHSSLYITGQGSVVAIALARWEPSAAEATLAEQLARCEKIARSYVPGKSQTGDLVFHDVGSLKFALKRIQDNQEAANRVPASELAQPDSP